MGSVVERDRCVAAGRVNWREIGEIIARYTALPDYTREDIGRRVAEVAAWYIPSDLADARDLRVEERLVRLDKGWTYTGIVDLAIKRAHLWHLIDWKLVNSQELKREAVARLTWDSAPAFYLREWPHGPASRRFCYRNVILRPPAPPGPHGVFSPAESARKTRVNKGDVVEIYREITVNDVAALDNQERYIRITSRLPAPWFQNAPESCNNHWGQCPHFTACDTGAIEEFPTRHAMSPSLIKTWRVCPERARHVLRDRGVEAEHTDDSGGNERMIAGTAFHAAIAEVYRQSWGSK